MGTFDDDIKKGAGDFRLEPREPVWERIEQELETKKRRRPIFWLWWLTPIAVAGIGIMYVSQSTPTGDAIVESTTTSGQPATSKELQEHKKSASATLAEKDFLPETHPTQTDAKSNASTGKASPEKGSLPEGQDQRILPESVQEEKGKAEVKKTTHTQNEIFQETSLTKYKTGKVIEEPTATGIFEETIITEDYNRSTKLMLACLPLRQLFLVPTTEYPVQIKIPMLQSILVSDTGKKVGSEPSFKKTSWNLIGGAGLHNVSGNGIGEQAKSADANNLPPLNSSGSGFSNAAFSMEPSQPGVGFVLGIERTQFIGKKNRWEWLAGLHYQYQTVRITTGAKKDSIFTTERNSTTLNYFNRPGNSVEQTGSQHRVHLLTGAKLLIGKQRKWAWQNGVYGGIVLSNNYLIPLSNGSGWVPSKGLTKTGFIGLETGIQFNPNRFGAGLFGQYNLNSSVSSSSLSNQYWRGMEVRISYKLFSK
jgi:hypothetical protein